MLYSIREGLVYVAMSLADLQQYMDPPHHARQRGIHSPPYRRRTTLLPGNIRSSPEQLSLLDALRDPEVNAGLAGTRSPLRHSENALGNIESRHRNHFSSFDERHRGESENHCELPDQRSETLGSDDHDGRVVFSSDEDVGPEDVTSQDVLDFRLQRLRLGRRRYELGSREREDRRSGFNTQVSDSTDADLDEHAASLDRLNALIARSRMDDKWYAEESSEDPSTAGVGIEEGMKDDRVTCVRFRIKQGKHKVTIKFEPAVSGRFILLKLWAGRGNVDIQSVIAKGYGSLRFFPAKEFR
nr:hypothetical protein CFP56_60696 [Quercus suber]